MMFLHPLLVLVLISTGDFLRVTAIGVTPEEVDDLLENADSVWREARDVLNSASSLRAMTDVEQELQRSVSEIRLMRVRLDRLRGEDVTPSIHGIKIELRRLQETLSTTMEEIRQQILDVSQQRIPEVQATGGRPRFIIDPGELTESFQAGVAFHVAARIQGVSDSTLYRRRRELGLLQRERYTNISDEDLDTRMRSILENDSNCGRNLAMGALRSDGVVVPTRRVSESLQRVGGPMIAARWQRPVERQPYRAHCPGWIVHCDTHHKLNGHPRRNGRTAVCWGITIQGGVDGYSKTCTFLSATGSNTAAFMMRAFLRGCREYGIPSRIRTDDGGENSEIGRFMVELRGHGHNAHLTGPSVRNVPIERFWGTMGDHCTRHFRKLFQRFEREGTLDPSSDIDIFALHFVYLPIINNALQQFRNWYDNHPIRTTEYRMSPKQLRITGYQRFRNSGYTSVIEHFNGPPIDVNTLIEDETEEEYLMKICRRGELQIDRECIENLFREVLPFELENGNGRDKFLLAKLIIQEYQNQNENQDD
ncbi:PREDICTED: uncharacterized protein LOC109468721 isoform X2 [Branchiostoma belcheri]|uniref:Uncharacterized protein LOC109468721 isoform X2 n=1 Tax=Branchiostoma belcheri TaxID=7741 RepID=A0A6P4Y124_BRABE|nr:PREDICTED: uncharacterized protein LOC109468721 isoform X2 [Branchiostoma belcheri]